MPSAREGDLRSRARGGGAASCEARAAGCCQPGVGGWEMPICQGEGGGRSGTTVAAAAAAGGSLCWGRWRMGREPSM